MGNSPLSFERDHYGGLKDISKKLSQSQYCTNCRRDGHNRANYTGPFKPPKSESTFLGIPPLSQSLLQPHRSSWVPCPMCGVNYDPNQIRDIRPRCNWIDCTRPSTNTVGYCEEHLKMAGAHIGMAESGARQKSLHSEGRVTRLHLWEMDQKNLHSEGRATRLRPREMEQARRRHNLNSERLFSQHAEAAQRPRSNGLYSNSTVRLNANLLGRPPYSSRDRSSYMG